MPLRATLAGLLLLATAHPALAQRFPFERSFDVTAPPTLDVSTERGRIEIVAGDAGQIVVAGTVTVREGWNVPANAIDLARKAAAAPPIERDGNTVRLRPPADEATRRAVTVSYQVRVPRETAVRAVSDSGATAIRGVSAPIEVKTQSAAIDLGSLGGSATVTSGSGAVKIDGAGGALTVSTASGQVEATFTGTGDADVETSSSAILLRGARGGVLAKTQSGRVSIEGTP